MDVSTQHHHIRVGLHRRVTAHLQVEVAQDLQLHDIFNSASCVLDRQFVMVLSCENSRQSDTAKVHPLTPPDSHHLSAAQGWIELGNHLEAGAELDKITPELRVHPDVLEIRWQMHAKENRWQDCEAIGHSIIEADPNRPSGWLNQATALRRQGKIKEAYANLYVVFDDFPDNWHVPYDLARYSALLGEFDEAREWFKKATLIDEKTVQKKGVDDPDLKPMWDSFQTP